jgi:hypothetical protein
VKEPAAETEPADADDDDDEDGIYENEKTGKLYLDEAMTQECDEFGTPVEDASAFDKE